MATARIECVSLFAAGRIYTFGGASLSAGGDSFTSVESIAPGEDTWRAEPPMPLEFGFRQGAGCVLVSNATQPTVSRPFVARFAPCFRRSFALSARETAVAEWRWAQDGKVYLVGGCEHHSNAPSNRAFLCFDPATGSWEHSATSGAEGATLPAHPSPPNAALVAAHGGKVWVMAGNPPAQVGPANHSTDDTGIAPSPVWTYTPGADAWEPGPDFPTHQSWGAAASFGGKLYAISGAHGTGASTGIIFDPRMFVLEED
eukprot:COSAG04_NODE_1810_length_5515_cov_6.783419_1_plen_258_part_00